MANIFFALKGQVNVLSLLMVLGGSIWLLDRHKKNTVATILSVITVVVLLLSSTAYLPRYLATQLENKFLTFDALTVKYQHERFYIHVLGSGNNLDKRLPANAQLGLAAIGRLAEAIRIHRILKNSIIICSANSMLGLETQASVTKRAAILLGVDSNRIEKLDTPSTTKEEAAALRLQYGTAINLIVVSDAMHLPRAMKLFAKEGFRPITAPTNYRAPLGPKGLGIKWWPSTGNISLMDIVLHEYLGNLKAGL